MYNHQGRKLPLHRSENLENPQSRGSDIKCLDVWVPSKSTLSDSHNHPAVACRTHNIERDDIGVPFGNQLAP